MHPPQKQKKKKNNTKHTSIQEYACSQHSCAGTWWVNQPGVWFSWADVGAAWVPARGSSFTYSYTNHNVGDDSSSVASSRVSRGYHSNPSPRRFDNHNRPVDENDFWACLPLFCCGWGGTADDFEPSSTLVSESRSLVVFLINPFPAGEFILSDLVVVLSENSLKGKFREPEIFIQRRLLPWKMHKKS